MKSKFNLCLENLLVVLFILLSSNLLISQLVPEVDPTIDSDARYIELDYTSIKSKLMSAPLDETSKFNFNSGVTLEFPFIQESDIIKVKVLETQIMDPSFSAKFPQIKTYRLIAENDPNFKGRITLNDELFYVTIFHQGKTTTINPIDIDKGIYEVNSKVEDLGEDWCSQQTEHPEKSKQEKQTKRSSATLINGSTLRTLDLALVCTGEFHDANGGTIAAATTVATNSINAIEAMYETDLAVNFNLLTPFVYTDPNTDPFDPTIPSRTSMAAAVVNQNFAASTYDIGHVFHDQNSNGTLIRGIVSNVNIDWQGAALDPSGNCTTISGTSDLDLRKVGFFSVTATGTYTIQTTNNTNFDEVIIIYQNLPGFNPNDIETNPCSFFLDANREVDAGGVLLPAENIISQTLTAGSSYFLVVSSASSGSLGTYEISYTGPGTFNGSLQFAGGGIAGLGVLCSTSTTFGVDLIGVSCPTGGCTGFSKALGWSGSFNNTNNGWYQLAAHEFGHMFDAPHTFNGSGSNCNSGNISSSTSYEIASGTTIMSYNGICGAGQNIPANGTADNYFHAHSLERMINELNNTSCYNAAASGNTPPTSNAGINYTIPTSTPFELTGTSTDANGDALTYCWEQYDEDGAGTPTQGFIGSTAGNSAIAPLFRSYPPSTNPARIFPNLTNILSGNNTGNDFEALPEVGRTLNFRLGVRDNNPNGGGYSCDEMSVTVDGNSGPFEITTQNIATTWNADGVATAIISWSVASTNNYCTNVDILLSTDGGLTFPNTLASGTANDGSHQITIPSYPTSIGRIKVVCSDNIFFDINNADIEITSSCIANGATFSPDTPVSAVVGDPSLNLNMSPNFSSQVNFPFSNTIDGMETPTSGSNASFECGTTNCTNFGGGTFYYDNYDIYPSVAGTYTFSINSNFSAALQIFDGAFSVNAGCNNLLGISRCHNASNSITSTVSTVSVTLTPGVMYSLAVSNFFFGTQTGNYTISLDSGPAGGSLYDGPNVPPGAGFSYTYMVVDNSTNNIVGFESNSNLTTYPSGSYTIYGLSYESSANLNPFVGNSLSSFQTDLALLTICGNLSSNTRVVTINSVGAPCFTMLNNSNGLQTIETGIADYESSDWINTTAPITIQNGASVDYDASNFIQLNNNFTVELGAVFEAFIDGCNNGGGGSNLNGNTSNNLKTKRESSPTQKSKIEN